MRPRSADDMSSHVTSRHVTSRHVTPRYIALHYVMPLNITSRYVTSHCATLRLVAPRRVTSRHAASRCVTLHHVASRCVMLRHVASRCVTLRLVTLRHVASRRVASRRVTVRHGASRCIALRRVTSRYVTSRHVTPVPQRGVAPRLPQLILSFSVAGFTRSSYAGYRFPAAADVAGWLVVGVELACIPVAAAVAVRAAGGPHARSWLQVRLVRAENMLDFIIIIILFIIMYYFDFVLHFAVITLSIIISIFFLIFVVAPRLYKNYIVFYPRPVAAPASGDAAERRLGPAGSGLPAETDGGRNPAAADVHQRPVRVRTHTAVQLNWPLGRRPAEPTHNRSCNPPYFHWPLLF